MHASAGSLVSFRRVRGALVTCALLAAAAAAAEPRWAELNREARQAVLVFDLGSDADFDSLHGTPRYEAALQCMTRNAQPVTHAHPWRLLDEADLLPEDIAFDPKSQQVLVSSIRTNKIIDSNGRLFASTDFPVLAIAVDEKRRTLWATTGWLPQCERCAPSDKGKTALVALDIDSREMKRRIESPVEGLLGDMTIGTAGDLFVSDNQSGAVFHLAAGASALERIDPPGEFASPQQPALSADESALYVADYVRGIAVITLATRALTWLQPSADIALSGIDGLKVHGQSFIAVQNGTHPARIVRMSLDLKRFEVLEANWSGLGEPTHGTLIGNRYLFVANTGWPEYDDNGKKRDGSAPVVSSIYEIELELQ